MSELRIEKVESEVHGTMFVLFEQGNLMRPIAFYPRAYLERDLKCIGFELREIPHTDAPPSSPTVKGSRTSEAD